MLLLCLSALRGEASLARTAGVRMRLSVPLSELTVDKVRQYTRPDEMIAHLTAMTDQADDLHMRRLLATAYASARNLKLAIGHIDAALAVDPSDVEMLFLKGVSLEHAGDIEEALDAYEAVLTAEPSNWRALFHVGKISMQVMLHTYGADWLRFTFLCL